MITTDRMHVACSRCLHVWAPPGDPVADYPDVCEACGRRDLDGPFACEEDARDHVDGARVGWDPDGADEQFAWHCAREVDYLVGGWPA